MRSPDMSETEDEATPRTVLRDFATWQESLEVEVGTEGVTVALRAAYADLVYEVMTTENRAAIAARRYEETLRGLRRELASTASNLTATRRERDVIQSALRGAGWLLLGLLLLGGSLVAALLWWAAQ